MGLVNEDWEVLKEISREVKVNYIKVGIGD